VYKRTANIFVKPVILVRRASLFTFCGSCTYCGHCKCSRYEIQFLWNINFLYGDLPTIRLSRDASNIARVLKFVVLFQFFLTEADVGKNRAEACFLKACELNTYVSMRKVSLTSVSSFLKIMELICLPKSNAILFNRLIVSLHYIMFSF